jgi:hypothetical protein
VVFSLHSSINNSLEESIDYLSDVPSAWHPRKITRMSTGTGSAKCRCAQCEQPEGNCECEKYCCLCQSVIDIRICTDGLMYCEPCRKACDYKTSD